MHHTIRLQPAFFTQNFETYLTEKLYKDVEGTCTGRFGYVIAVLDTNETLEISQGKVIPSIGLAEFEVAYRAIVFKPFKGEVVDGVVSQVNKVIDIFNLTILEVNWNHFNPNTYI